MSNEADAKELWDLLPAHPEEAKVGNYARNTIAAFLLRRQSSELEAENAILKAQLSAAIKASAEIDDMLMKERDEALASLAGYKSSRMRALDERDDALKQLAEAQSNESCAKFDMETYKTRAVNAEHLLASQTEAARGLREALIRCKATCLSDAPQYWIRSTIRAIVDDPISTPEPAKSAEPWGPCPYCDDENGGHTTDCNLYIGPTPPEKKERP